MARRDFYEVLGVGRNGRRPTTSSRAYRKLARTYHPDVNKDPGAEDRFKEVSEASRRALRPRAAPPLTTPSATTSARCPRGVDPQTRGSSRRRSRSRSCRRHGRPGTRAMPSGSRWRRRDRLRRMCLATLPGVPAPIVGSRSPAPTRRPSLRSLSRRRSGAAAGRSHCPARMAAARYDVTIPPGVTDGQRIRLAGQGGRGTGRRRPVTSPRRALAPHLRYRAERRHLRRAAAGAVRKAALGATSRASTHRAARPSCRCPRARRAGGACGWRARHAQPRAAIRATSWPRRASWCRRRSALTTPAVR